MAAAVGKSSVALALDMFLALDKENGGRNIFFSPLSVSSALAMVYLGAKGSTATQMHKTLSFPSGEVHASFQALNADINSPSSAYKLKLANRLYGEASANFLTEFQDATRKFYHADLKAVDFIGAPDDCRVEINSWVEQQTENKIKDLLKPGTVTPNTRMALVNAVYFKGDWMNKFDPSNTQSMDFKINKAESKPVQMMFLKEKLPFNYIPEEGIQIVELPYKGEELSMVILLPEDNDGGSEPLTKLVENLTPEKLAEWTNKDTMDTMTDILVHLPKFKLEEDYELKDYLAKMGMPDLFSPATADLSGMTGEGGLFLSAVAHKAFVEVNEEGTEAAAATAGIAAFCMLREEHVTADHPFLFFIRHNKTNAILFMGRFSVPQ